MAEGTLDLRPRRTDVRIPQMRTGRCRAIPRSAEASLGLRNPRPRNLLGCGSERAPDCFGRTLLSGDVLWRPGILEPARHAHVRNTRTFARGARTGRKGNRLGA